MHVCVVNDGGAMAAFQVLHTNPPIKPLHTTRSLCALSCCCVLLKARSRYEVDEDVGIFSIHPTHPLSVIVVNSSQLNMPWAAHIVVSQGGFPSICHNELCNIAADLLSEVCPNVGVKPSLQPVMRNNYPTEWQIEKMVLNSIPLLRVFKEIIGNVHFLMSGYSTPLHRATTNPHSLSAIERIRWREGHVIDGSVNRA